MNKWLTGFLLAVSHFLLQSITEYGRESGGNWVITDLYNMHCLTAWTERVRSTREMTIRESILRVKWDGNQSLLYIWEVSFTWETNGILIEKKRGRNRERINRWVTFCCNLLPSVVQFQSIPYFQMNSLTALNHSRDTSLPSMGLLISLSIVYTGLEWQLADWCEWERYHCHSIYFLIFTAM